MPCALPLRNCHQALITWALPSRRSSHCIKYYDTLRNVRTPQLSVKRALMSAWPFLDVLTTMLQIYVPGYHLQACQSHPLQGVAGLA